MFLKTEIQENQYIRKSKSGIEHFYARKKIIANFRCDCCDSLFERDLKHIDRKRLNNKYFHCCGLCDAKRFAQRKGVEKKKIWDLPASVELPIGKF
jgi:predicted metal-binding protein